MKTRLKSWLRPLVYACLRWFEAVQGELWCRRVPINSNQRGLDIGCGPKKRPGFVGTDKHLCQAVDVLCNFECGTLPFASSTFDVVYANHILEHIANLDSLLGEISRVMKPGARLQVGVPYAGGLRAFQDPTHVRFFTVRTFEYYVREGSRVGGWYASKYFTRIVRRRLVFGRDPLSLLISIIVNRSLILLDLYESSVLRMVPARDLHVELEK